MINEIKLPAIESRLERVESLLIQVRDIAFKASQKPDDIIPVSQIVGKTSEGKLISAPAFYDHVKKGRFTILKLGKRSFVNRVEFYAAFKEINVSKSKEVK